MPSSTWFTGPVIQTLALDAALAEAVLALRAAQVEPLLIKGPAVASLLYDEPTERTYGDVDLLVAREHLEPTRRVLTGLGYGELEADLRPQERSPHAATFSRERDGATVDLHWQLNLLPIADAYELLARDSTTLTVAGVGVQVPAPAAQALIAGLHAAQHQGSEVPALADVTLAVERISGEDWVRAAGLAAEAGVGAELRAGLELAPEGEELADRLELPPVSIGLRLRSDELFTTARADAFRRSSDWRERLRLLFQAIFPSPGFMRRFVPLARRGPIGLALAYPLRIPRLAAQAARAALRYLRVLLR